MFEWMAQQPFDWSAVDIFQVDERVFPPDHPQSNYRMLREALLDHVAIAPQQVHRMKGELDPAQAASEYAAEIESVMGPGIPVFDVIQRGMGSDAHTASLFPGEPKIEDVSGVVTAVWVEKLKQNRITLLRAPLEHARATVCLITGVDKAAPLSRVLSRPPDFMRLPAQIKSPETEWFVDTDAASLLSQI